MKVTTAKSLKNRKGIFSSVKRNMMGWLMLLPAVLCMYFFILRPMVMGAYLSFFDMKGYTPQEFIGLENYRNVISNSSFTQTLLNTCKYVWWSVIVGFFLPIILSLMLNEMVHLRASLRFLLYLPAVLPASAAALLWYFIYHPSSGGLLNMVLMHFGLDPYVWLQDSGKTILYIIISMTWAGAGSNVLYYYATLQGVNRELYEAAVIDGSGFFRRLKIITLPHISGIVLLFFVRQIIGVFSVMEQPMMMTDGGPNGASMTLGLQIYKYAFVYYKPQLAIALSCILFLILVVFTSFYYVLDKKVENMNG